MNAIICGKKIKYKGVVFQVDGNDTWSILVFGHPIGSKTMIPKYFYRQIEKDRVPKEVIEKGKL